MSNSRPQLGKCICSGKSLDRMLRPAVLTILCDHAQGLHGYAVEQELQKLRFFRDQPPDFTGLYRLLKRMESEELLSSTKSDSEAGPSKRVYRLTDRGRRCLARWLDSLRKYQEMLEDLLTRAKESIEVTETL
ncbi:MAG: PadR family transcriptional regulator [Sedimentisphaerales bacterium]|nr:PadR family transcriptional regulator [Sedimentisphaerales bacterium]NLZ06095.1 PadR family transcriptional regulator [Phycisphaerae bacterium]HNY76986.1 PadR family transcriptional regulator [Sedimentisphaerales bacterium]HOC64709.1 PadR family transcriptional regulator [Sedimentisphaerales bacterium]HOH62760.1 PadR family transcriptional regulator [Sedimentisphaerales bacterium]